MVTPESLVVGEKNVRISGSGSDSPLNIVVETINLRRCKQ